MFRAKSCTPEPAQMPLQSAEIPPDRRASAIEKGMRFVCIMVLLAPAGLAAQARSTPKKAAPPPAATQWPIETLAVEGNRFYARDQVLAVAGLKVGQMAGKAEFDAARDRLVASG